MRNKDILKATEILHLEVPDSCISGLLCILVAEKRILGDGELQSFPERPGCWYLFALVDGTLQMTHEGSLVNLQKGNAVIFSGNSVSSVWPSGGGTLLIFCLQGSAADEIVRETRKKGGNFFRDGAEAALRAYRELESISLGETIVSAARASASAYAMLMQLYGRGRNAAQEKYSMPKVVEESLKIMQSEFAFLEGIGELAVRMEVSQEYLTRCFRKSMGVPPGKYLNRLKIEYAKLLFRQGRHTVSFVADACGFANGNYFGKVFREMTGFSPTEYIKQYQFSEIEDPMLDPFYIL